MKKEFEEENELSRKSSIKMGFKGFTEPEIPKKLKIVGSSIKTILKWF